MSSNPKFDVLITENFNSRLFFAVSYKLKVPMICLSSSALLPWASYDVANPINPSYIPSILSYNPDRMNFLQRLSNVYTATVSYLAYEFIFNPKAEELKKKYFGEEVPPLKEIAKNISLTLVNSHFTFNRPRPLVPGVIEVGGQFVKPKKPIPEVGAPLVFGGKSYNIGQRAISDSVFS